MMTRNGERTESKMALRNQMRYERAVNPAVRADVANGNSEVIGGEGCPLEGAAIRIAAEDELCAMVGESRLVRLSYDLCTSYHMTSSGLFVFVFFCFNCVTQQRQVKEALSRQSQSFRWGRYTLPSA